MEVVIIFNTVICVRGSYPPMKLILEYYFFIWFLGYINVYILSESDRGWHYRPRDHVYVGGLTGQLLNENKDDELFRTGRD